MANMFRVMLHCVSHNLVVSMRRLVRLDDPATMFADSETDDSPAEAAVDDEATAVASSSPTERETESQMRRRHNTRRRRDILGEAHPATWRMLVIKVAARVIVSAQRVRILLSTVAQRSLSTMPDTAVQIFSPPYRCIGRFCRSYQRASFEMPSAEYIVAARFSGD